MIVLRNTIKIACRCLLFYGLLVPAAAFAAEPPTPVVTAERAGRLLTLSCELRGADGRKHHPNGSDTPPQFAVYQGERLVGSGSFEYG